MSKAKAEKVQGRQAEPAHLSTIKEMMGLDILDESTNQDAERALSAVARKLDKGLSVEYVVNELIAEATDPHGLANMFTGKSRPGRETTDG